MFDSMDWMRDLRETFPEMLTGLGLAGTTVLSLAALVWTFLS